MSTLKLHNKEDIEFHSDGFRDRKPAVNVKVYDGLDNGFRKWKKDNPDEDERFTLEWIDENCSEDYLDNMFWSTCEYKWEFIQDFARELWDDRSYQDPQRGTRHTINVYSEGRSGGWAVVDGINTDVDSWDAIEFTRWKRFAEYARAEADHVMNAVVDAIYCNRFDEWQLEESELAAPDLEEALNERTGSN